MKRLSKLIAARLAGMRLVTTTAVVALALPVFSLADVTGSTTLTSGMTLNLDTGATGTSGGDLLWSGTTLTPQGSATAGVLPGLTGSAAYGGLTSGQLAIFAVLLSNAGISSGSAAANAIIVVHTNGGNYAKLLVTSNSGGSLGLQYTTFGAAGGGGGGGPTITDVQNAATNIPSGLPNGALAQGALFVVKGSNLGPATFTQAAAFPLPPSIGGVSITVTVGSTTVNCIMFYALARQVSAILPSNTPTGAGTLKLTYNGQSASFQIKVVQNNIGIYTVSQTGSGDAIAFLNDDSQLISPTHAANAGDVLVFWGTGLGPVNFDETQPAVQSDMTNVPLHVFIGGKEAQINFRGRNGCCSSADSIYVTVPAGVVGCAVSVVMQVGNMVSNGTSIAVGQNGRTCTPLNPQVPVGFTGTYKVGGVSLSRTVETFAGILGQPRTTTKLDSGAATFEKITYTSAPPTGAQLDINSYGSCSISNYQQGSTPPTPNGGTVTPLDAGAAITINGPGSFGTKTLQKSTVGSFIFYGGQFDQTATTLTPGAYTITGPGGADVGQFTANYALPTIFTWTDQSSITTVNRANGVTVHWTGGNPNGYVTISGSSTAYGSTAATTVVVMFTCNARVSDGSFTVPPAVLLALPPSGSATQGGPVIPGQLLVESFDYQTFGPPPGLDAAVIDSIFVYGTSATYQ